ncbi:MAG TPA: CHASE2 domain-containing protein [Leptolyngbyaceae cyanobacterium M33_DOE_097]|uniref:CHASE2 domain-containing protein n=1 Tax=Oscillatoriales cyanobacterium SpSt-418 TaxID=2282169 RepID=A0A7C3PH10_9CYAN|nr:CHASE2 domain-containing protein [Leptolyngbyaceae cyanobacterium M33_DOE_097]
MVRRFSDSWRSLWQSSRTVLLTSAAVTVGLVGLREVGALQALELNFYDRMMRLRPTEQPDSRLLVVGITEEDLRRWKYPISDKTLLDALERLEAEEPRAIGLDIIRDGSVQGPAGDRQALLQFMQESGVLVAVCRVPDRTGSAADQGFPPPEGLAPEQFGAANLGADPDSVVRRAFLTLTPPEKPQQSDASTPPPPNSPCNDSSQTIPYFGLQLALNYLDAENIQMEPTPDNFIKLGSTIFKPLPVRTGPYRTADIGGKQGYQMLINYRSNRQLAEEVTLTDVLEGKVSGDRIKDKVVLVGYVAESVKDTFATPFNQQRNLPPMPGVVIHAHVVSQILSAVQNQRSLIWFWHPALENIWIAAWAVGGALLAWRIRRPVLLLGAIALGSLTIFGISYWLFTQAGWIPVVPPLLTFILGSGVVVLFTRGVAQAIYEGVRGFLKLDIEIDKEKKERDVAEIAESDYFRDLQARSEELRREKQTTNGSTSDLLDQISSSSAATTMQNSNAANNHHPDQNSKHPRVSPDSATEADLQDTPEEPLIVQYRPDLDAITPPIQSTPYLNLDVDLIQLFADDRPKSEASPVPPMPPEPPASPAPVHEPAAEPELPPPVVEPFPLLNVQAPEEPTPAPQPPLANDLAQLEDLLQPPQLETPLQPPQPESSRLLQSPQLERPLQPPRPESSRAIADLESLFHPSTPFEANEPLAEEPDAAAEFDMVSPLPAPPVEVPPVNVKDEAPMGVEEEEAREPELELAPPLPPPPPVEVPPVLPIANPAQPHTATKLDALEALLRPPSQDQMPDEPSFQPPTEVQTPLPEQPLTASAAEPLYVEPRPIPLQAESEVAPPVTPAPVVESTPMATGSLAELLHEVEAYYRQTRQS